MNYVVIVHFRSNTRVSTIHSSAVPLAAHHWYPDRHDMKLYAGKDMLVSDEMWQKFLDIGIDVSLKEVIWLDHNNKDLASLKLF